MPSQPPPAPLFQPFRALGYITDDTPFAVQRRGKETWVTVSVGKTWQVYNCAKLTLVLVGPQLKGDIRALACKDDRTFAAVGQTVIECKRVHRSGAYRGRSLGCAAILQMLVLGDLLLVLGASGCLVTWRIGQYDEPQSVIKLSQEFRPTVMVHPDTYVNKILLGSESGTMQLWNFVTCTLVYTFKGWGSAVRSLASSPALDVVGVGLQDGRVVLHNLRYDEAVTSFANASGTGLEVDMLLGASRNRASAATAGACAVTTLSFYTGRGKPLMAAGGGAGVITIWDLERRILHTVIKDAHDAPLLSLHFFVGEPRLMSSGADNSIKQWVLDAADGSARLLRFRSGHSAPPSCINHYGEGLRLLSAGLDRAFRVFSVHQDQQSRELSQGHASKRAKKLHVREADVKLPRVTGMDASEVRERDWCNVITSHEGDPHAYTWRLQHFTIGQHQLHPPRSVLQGEVAAAVTCVALSRCGNFGVVGSASGRVDRYNMQSGMHRGAFSCPGASRTLAEKLKAGPVTPGLPAHEGGVVGAAIDGANRLLITCGLDSSVRIWSFKQQRLLKELPLGVPATHLALHPGSALAAVAGDDRVIRVIDVEAARLVRRFKGHRDRITALQISSDGHWLLSASMDGTLRVWDIPAGVCLQAMRLGSPCTGVSLSPALDLLATTHAGRRGIYLWSNQMLFGQPGAPIGHSEAIVDISMPTITTGNEDELPSATGRRRGGSGGDGQAARGSSSSGEEDGCSSGSTGKDSDSEGSHDQETGSSSEGASSSEGGIGDGTGSSANGELVDGRPWERRAAAAGGAPAPLAPALVTLSLLPRSQVESLAVLEAIRARNKPLQPPTKPEAAPFFLPTKPGLSARPVFEAPPAPSGAEAGAALAVESSKRVRADAAARGSDQAAAGPAVDGGEGGGAGWGDAEEEADGEEAAAREDTDGTAAGPSSRIVNSMAQRTRSGEASAPLAASPFVRLLRSGGGDPQDYSAFVAHIRQLTPVALDRELRAMQVLEGDTEVEEAGCCDLGLLLSCLESQLAGGANFEFCQALLQLTVQVHGETLMRHPELQLVANRIRERLRTTWTRLDGLLQSARCMVNFFGNLQG